jgi:hypothetical protein
VRPAVLLSCLVGLAFVIVGVPFILLVGLWIATAIITGNLSAHGQFGWDVVSLAHNYPVVSILLPVCLFIAGFLIAFRYFSGSRGRN